MDPASIAIAACVMAMFGAAFYYGHTTSPRYALKQIARMNQWTFREYDEVTVDVPTPAGTVALASWTTHRDNKKVRGWSASAPMALPRSFVQHHGERLRRAVDDSLGLGRGQVDWGPVVIRMTTQTTAVASLAEQAAKEVTRIARRFDGGHSDPLEGLRHLASAPPDTEIAWAVLDWSLRKDPESPHLPQLITWGLESESPRFRLTAARAVDDERALEPLLEVIRSGRNGAEVRREALNILIHHPAWRQQSTAQRDRVAGMLIGIVPLLSGKLLIGVLDALDDHFDVPVAPEILHARLTSVGTPARVALVKAMRRHGAAAEPQLIAALRDGKRAVRILAARGLRDHGTLRALKTLQEVADKWTTLSSEDAALHEAIAAIEARHPEELRSAGGLALSEQAAVERGGLSEAVEQAGQLELT